MQLIGLRDRAQPGRTAPPESAAQVFASFERQIVQLLDEQGVTPLESDDAFDNQYQEVVHVEPTADPEQDERIKSTVRPGYVYAGKLIRPQQVIVYQYEAP
jgi:molecular chaperone GrpE (heat shock protein)